MDNLLGFLGCFYLIPSLIIGGIGFLLGWFLKPKNRVTGDLSVEGEGALRAEADSLRARVQDLEGRISTRDTEVSDLKTKLAAAAAGAAAGAGAASLAKTSDDDETYALEWQNRYLAARVKYLESRIAEEAEAKPAAKKAPAKKKTATRKKATGAAAATAAAAGAATLAAKPKPKPKAKPKTKAVAKAKTKAVTKTAPAKTAAAKKAPAKKAAPKKAAPKKDAKFERYYENVKKYDARASRSVVQNIVDYCGVALKSRDSSLVACSDEAELKRVANGFVTKKLGMNTGQMDLVQDVCQQMKGQRQKSRVTFYYLAAKKAKKLSVFK